MLVRHKSWFEDGLPAHIVNVGLADIVFTDAAKGVTDIRDKALLEAVLRHPTRQYEIAYEAYGITFDNAGKQVDTAPPPPTFTFGTPSSNIQVTTTSKKKR